MSPEQRLRTYVGPNGNMFCFFEEVAIVVLKDGRDIGWYAL